MTKVSVVVYGADVVCASCVNAPTSRNTFEWIQSLLERKYPDIQFEYTYIDFQKQTENLSDHDQHYIEQLEEDELFYPLITMNDEYVADGYIQTKQLTNFVDKHFANNENKQIINKIARLDFLTLILKPEERLNALSYVKI